MRRVFASASATVLVLVLVTAAAPVHAGLLRELGKVVGVARTTETHEEKIFVLADPVYTPGACGSAAIPAGADCAAAATAAGAPTAVASDGCAAVALSDRKAEEVFRAVGENTYEVTRVDVLPTGAGGGSRSLSWCSAKATVPVRAETVVTQVKRRRVLGVQVDKRTTTSSHPSLSEDQVARIRAMLEATVRGAAEAKAVDDGPRAGL